MVLVKRIREYAGIAELPEGPAKRASGLASAQAKADKTREGAIKAGAWSATLEQDHNAATSRRDAEREALNTELKPYRQAQDAALDALFAQYGLIYQRVRFGRALFLTADAPQRDTEASAQAMRDAFATLQAPPMVSQ